MKVSKNKLLSALNSVKHGLARNEIIDQSTSFVFSGNKIHTFNDEISVCAPFDTKGIECAVPSKELLAFINRVTVDELEISFDENQLKCSGKRVRAGINAHAEVTLPIIELEDGVEWLDIPERFIDGIKLTAESAGKDASQMSLECIHIKDYKMSSCDNYAATVYKLGSEWDKESLIPARNLALVAGFRPLQYQITEDWVHFKNSDNAIFSIRPYSDNFEDISDIMEVEGIEISLPDTLETALTDAEIFVTNDTVLTVNVAISKNQIMVSNQGDTGWIEKIVRMKYNDKKISFIINPVLFKKILKSSNNVTVGNESLKFVGDHFTHVICLEEPE